MLRKLSHFLCFKNMRLIITVKEGAEDIIKPTLLKVNDYYFKSLFHKIILDVYRQRNFEVHCRVNEKFPWTNIEKYDELITEIIQEFNFTELKFTIDLAIHQSVTLISSRRNALDIIMQNTIQPKLPNKKQPQVTHNNLLYNELIILFETKKVSWTGGLHLLVSEKCVKRLTKLLWYIDPHLKKFAKCGYH